VTIVVDYLQLEELEGKKAFINHLSVRIQSNPIQDTAI
jgi:hypothetical protein